MFMIGVFCFVYICFDINAIAKECLGQDDIPFYSVQNLGLLFVWVNIANFALLCNCSLSEMTVSLVRKQIISVVGCHGSVPLTMTGGCNGSAPLTMTINKKPLAFAG